MTPTPQQLQVVATLAKGNSLDYALVCSVIEQESDWIQWAYRFEPAFKEQYVDPLGLPITEAIGRSISWGPMQVMGQVAREFGFKGNFPQLCIFETGVLIGCSVLAHKEAAAGGNMEKALLLWNGGANAQYPQQVFDRISKYKSSTGST